MAHIQMVMELYTEPLSESACLPKTDISARDGIWYLLPEMVDILTISSANLTFPTCSQSTMPEGVRSKLRVSMYKKLFILDLATGGLEGQGLAFQ